MVADAGRLESLTREERRNVVRIFVEADKGPESAAQTGRLR
jgi:hypothetical protein